MQEKDIAICLRTVNYSETSQVVTLLGRSHGKLSCIAKGSKRAKSSFDGPIEVFSYGEIIFSERAGSHLATLTEFSQKPVFLPLRRNLRALNSGLLAAELVENFTHEHDANPDLFDEFVRFLEDLQRQSESQKMAAYLILFQLNLLASNGIGPVFNACVNCGRRYEGRWHAVYFSSGQNGLVCPDCEQAFVEKVRLSPATATTLADLKNIPIAAEQTLLIVERLLIYHFTHLMHRKPKTAHYFFMAEKTTL